LTTSDLSDGAYYFWQDDCAAPFVLFLVRGGQKTYLPRQTWLYQVRELFAALGYQSPENLFPHQGIDS
jgi:hypothetical protein